jgi:hypothetical protein
VRVGAVMPSATTPLDVATRTAVLEERSDSVEHHIVGRRFVVGDTWTSSSASSSENRGTVDAVRWHGARASSRSRSPDPSASLTARGATVLVWCGGSEDRLVMHPVVRRSGAVHPPRSPRPLQLRTARHRGGCGSPETPAGATIELRLGLCDLPNQLTWRPSLIKDPIGWVFVPRRARAGSAASCASSKCRRIRAAWKGDGG